MAFRCVYMAVSYPKVSSKPRDRTPGSPINVIDYSFLLPVSPITLFLRVDYSSFALSIEAMSRELRKDPKPRRPFEQAEARSQSQSAISPIKRPAERRQQSATQA